LFHALTARPVRSSDRGECGRGFKCIPAGDVGAGSVALLRAGLGGAGVTFSAFSIGVTDKGAADFRRSFTGIAGSFRAGEFIITGACNLRAGRNGYVSLISRMRIFRALILIKGNAVYYARRAVIAVGVIGVFFISRKRIIYSKGEGNFKS